MKRIGEIIVEAFEDDDECFNAHLYLDGIGAFQVDTLANYFEPGVYVIMGGEPALTQNEWEAWMRERMEQ